jgi:HAD superfamily hydrolase (TIGR01509 family)
VLTTVVLDVGETLVDETAHWTAWAEHLGVPAFTLFAALGGLVARGQDHRDVVHLVRPDTDFAAERPHVPEPPLELYPDARACLQALRADGWRTVVGGNQPASFQRLVERLDLPVDLVTSSGELGAEKPSREFYARLAERAGVRPEQCVHVGDRVDNDAVGAAAAGMAVVHLRRGPWALLHPAAGGHRIDGLAELPPLLRALRSRNRPPEGEVLVHLPS